DGKTRQEIERELAADYNRKLAAEVERRVAARAKEIERQVNRRLAVDQEEHIQRKLKARKEKYEDDTAKWMKSMEDTKNVEERKLFEGKLATEKKNWVAYEKRKTDELETLRLQIEGLVDTDGPSTRENSLE
ncbi:hypothetical protein HK104_007946, partial [Borealophlyctis nickersoniae]